MEKWNVYIQEAITQIDFARKAYQQFEEARNLSDTGGVFYSLHHFMLHLASVDRLLAFRPNTERARYLGGKIDLSGVDLKAARRMRNHLEHYDERLDSWIETNCGNAFFDMNIVTGSVGFPHSFALRSLDGDALFFMGERYMLPDLFGTMLLLDERLRAISG